MADSSHDREGAGGTGAARPGTPRWVKVFGAIAVVLVLLVGILLLSGGNHGPGRHTGSGDGRQTTALNVSESEAGHQPPAGGHTP